MMWEDMYQMSLDTSGLGVERHASLPEMSKIDFAEWKENENPFERRSSFTTISNAKKSNSKRGKGRRQRPDKKIDHGYITQTFLNEKIAWDEELNISSKSSSVKSKKQTISLKNSIQALLEANDSLVTDSYKTLKDATELKSSNDSLQPSENGVTNGRANGVVNGDGHDKNHHENSHVENLGHALLKEHALYTTMKENESKVAYSYTIDAELSYQEYNKLMHIIVNTLKEKRKWEEFIKGAEEKMDTTNKERLELMDNNTVLRESLETANKAIKDISGKVQKLKESLGPLRDENTYLKLENREQKDDIDKLMEEKKEAEKNLQELSESKHCRNEKELQETEMEEYKKNMHDKFRKLEEAYRNYRNEMESKHTDMNRAIDEMKLLYDSSKCSVDELKKENVMLKRELEAFRMKNDQLNIEIKERWESDKKLITANAENQIRYEQSQKIEDEYKKQIMDTKEKIEKQKWEVFFSKEEATTLEKENKQLKQTISSMEDMVKLMERKYDMAEKERECESKQSHMLREELKDNKCSLLELNELKRRNVEVTQEIEVYKKQEITLEELRIEFEAMKRENYIQKSENERLRTDVEKLKNEAGATEKTLLPQQQKQQQQQQQPADSETKRLLSEMENLRNQLKILDDNQYFASVPQQDEIRIELEAMRKDMSVFLETMHAKNEENGTKAMKEDIGLLKRQLSELDFLGRSKSSSLNGLPDSDKFIESPNECSDQDLNEISEKENGIENSKKNTSSAIQLVIDDDQVKWMDVPVKQNLFSKVKVESKFVKRNENQSENNELLAFNGSLSKKNENDFKKSYSDNESESVIYANIQKPSKVQKTLFTRSSSTPNSLESDEEHIKSDKKISFKDESDYLSNNHENRYQGSNPSITQDDHIYAIVTNKTCAKRNVDKTTELGGYHSSLPRPKKDGVHQKKGLSRSNTYLHTDYNHIAKKYQSLEKKGSNNNLLEKSMESRQTQAMIHKLKGSNSTEAMTSPIYGSPKKVKHSQSQSAIYRTTSCHVGNNTASLPRTRKPNDEERKPALPHRSMSRKKPNELFQSQRTSESSKEQSAQPPERNLKPSQSKMTHNKTTGTLARAESMKVKGEEPYLYASIRKKTASESKESFLKRMDSANTVERLQLERMEAARQKAMEKALQDDITPSNVTIKRKLASGKTTLSQTASITVHGIPVRRNANTSKKSEFEDNKEFSFKNNRRHSTSTNTPEKTKPTSKLKRVASFPKADDFKHLKDGIKNQLSKGKLYPQRSFEFLTEESLKKYKYVRDTLKLKNLCLRADKRARTGDMLHINGLDESGRNSVSKETHVSVKNGGLYPREPDLDANSEFIANECRVTKSEEYLSKSERDRNYEANVEAIYENASNYSHIRSSGETTMTQITHSSPQLNNLSFSDVDLTSLSNDEDCLSWQRYYPTGETTPRHSLLSLV